MEKERLIPECLQQTNTGDVGVVSQVLQRFTRKYRWPIVLRRFRNRIEAFHGKISEENLNALPRRSRTMAYIEHSQGENRQIETECT